MLKRNTNIIPIFLLIITALFFVASKILVEAEEYTPECVDSDNGITYYIKGKVTGRGSGELYEQWFTRSDACYVETNPEYIEFRGRLKEMACMENDEISVITYECPYGCSGSACICPKPYMEINSEGSCLWACAAGTKPDAGIGECVCKDDYKASGKDSSGRLVCTIGDNILPDLTLNIISVNPSSPKLKEAVTVTVKVSNTGERTLYDSGGLLNYNYVFNNFELTDEVTINTLASEHDPFEPGEIVSYSFLGFFKKTGTSTLSFTVDKGNQLTEENEDNNSLEISIGVNDPEGLRECYDSDYGRDYYTKGKIIMPSGFSFTDFCRNELELSEVYCTSTSSWDIFTYNCKIGCQNSACLRIEDLNCESFTYSNCPGDCEKICLPSSCTSGTCTTDCDGVGSCYTPGIEALDMSSQARLLFENNMTSILTKLGELRDSALEQLYQVKYLDELKTKTFIPYQAEQAMINFIAYGVDSNTKYLGAGERAAVIYSYWQAYSKLPDSQEELIDVIKIANGRWPGETNQSAEKRAQENFKKIYKKIPNMKNSSDEAAIVVMAYGLRQNAENRNLLSEKAGINTFKAIYGYHPNTTTDWNIMQAITYSGATREPDTDSDYLIDSREIEFGTDINNPDTDNDGFLDGDEILSGYNPLGP